jgi:hypothetical protein
MATVSLEDAYAAPSGTVSYEDATGTQPPPPERGFGERVWRGAKLVEHGIDQGAAGAIGLLPDLAIRGTNALGWTNIPEGTVTKALSGPVGPTVGPQKEGDTPAQPVQAENTTERILHGGAEGVGGALAGLGVGGALSAARAAPVVGRALGATGDFLSAAPGMQVASGTAAGATSEATDNPWLGLAAGAGLPIGTRMASMLLNPVTTRLTPELMRLRDYAEQSGIRLTPGEATGSRPLQVVESTLEQLPGSSGPQGALKQQQAEQFNRASMAHSNTPGDYPTMDVLNTRRAEIGGQIGSIAERNSLNLGAEVPAAGQANAATRPLLDELQDINRQARLNSTSQVAGPVDRYTRELMQHVQQDGTIPGTFYRAFDTQLGTAIKDAATADVAGGLTRLRNAVRNGFDASVGPQDAAAWQQARREYANLMTTRDAMSGAGQQLAAGNLPPTALRGALDRSMGRGSYGTGAGDQNDLARLGQSSLMRPPVGDSGTGIRSEAISALTGNSLLARGALGAASAVGIPRAVQAVINSDAGRHWLINGLAPGLRGQPSVPAIGSIMAQRLLQANQPRQ